MLSKTQQAIDAIKTGDIETGKNLLSEVIKENPEDEKAWLWMAYIVKSSRERRICLQRALAINPNIASAREALQKLNAQPLELPNDELQHAQRPAINTLQPSPLHSDSSTFPQTRQMLSSKAALKKQKNRRTLGTMLILIVGIGAFLCLAGTYVLVNLWKGTLPETGERIATQVSELITRDVLDPFPTFTPEFPITNTTYKLENAIIGLWKFTTQNSDVFYAEFASDGSMAGIFGTSYKVVSENTVLLTYSYPGEKSTTVLRVIDYSKNELQAQWEDNELTGERIKSLPSLSKDIVGLWVFRIDDEYKAWDFMSNNTVAMAGGYGLLKYKFIGQNCIVIWGLDYGDYLESNGTDTLFVISSSDTEIWIVEPPEYKEILTGKRKPGISNLAKKIIGIWRYSDSAADHTIEFTDSGEYIVIGQDITQVYTYEIATGNTIIVRGTEGESTTFVVEAIKSDMLILLGGVTYTREK